MPSKIEDYAIIGDTKTVALVDLTGSIDWWCAPRIDSAAAFAALLGDAGNGRWLIAPKGEVTKVTREYEPETLILDTIFETSMGSVSVYDFMPPYDGHSMIHRIVEARGGTVEMQMELIVRYEYGAITPWATATGDGLVLVAGRDGLRLHSPVRLVGNDNTTVASFSVSGDITTLLLAHLVPLRDPRPAPSRQPRRPQPHTALLAQLGRSLHLQRRLTRLGRPLAHHLEGPHLRAQRGGLRGGDDLAPRDHRGQPQLGLPLYPGSGTRPSPCTPCWSRGTPTKRRHGCGGSAAPSRGPPGRCRSCMASTENGCSPSSSSTSSRGTKDQRLSASATKPCSSFSSTSTARSWTQP